MTTVLEIIASLPHDDFSRIIPSGTILTVLRGSLSHGTHVPKEEKDSIDDIDLMSVFVAPREFYFGLPSTMRGQDIKVDDFDTANYEFRHFCGLLANGNPNVVSALWTLDAHTRVWGPSGEKLRAARGLFLSKRLYNSFAGYAHGQIMRMTSFKDVVNTCGCEGEFHSAKCAENLGHGRGSAKRFATGYMGEKRKALVAKFGYDAKNAAHAIRLLKMAIEIFESEFVRVDRTGVDAHELISIKKGEWELSKIKQYTEELFESLKESVAVSSLREAPDRDAINRLMCEILTSEVHP